MLLLLINNAKIQAIFIIFLFLIILLISVIENSIRIKHRYKKFTLEPLSSNNTSLLDRLKKVYNKIYNALIKYLIKIKIFDEYSNKYKKYCNEVTISKERLLGFIANKLLAGFLGIILIVLSFTIQDKQVTFLYLTLGFLLGFFFLDIIWLIKDRIRKKQVEKDMIKSIIIMNNAFKSGMSIMQAIFVVSNELTGPISEEFKKMYVDLEFGLSMEEAFSRFTKRVDNKEAEYIATSLNVLNKTGGNIVQVFASVEKNAFMRKKLNEELSSLAASSNAIFKILVIIPIFLFGIIFILNNEYFIPLFTTSIGITLLIIMLLIYILYIIIIKKIVKVKVEV